MFHRVAARAAFLALLASGCTSPSEGTPPVPPGADTLPNIILIITDDQDVGSLAHMPRLQETLVRQGLRFDNAFVTTPVCCPSRATMLRGQYAHNHGVRANRQPYGGAQGFRQGGNEDVTVATLLRDAGYRTVYLGKYLNGYDGKWLPRGWDEWQGQISSATYLGATWNVDGVVIRTGDDVYLTDDLAERAGQAVSRLRTDTRPLLMVVAPFAPHEPEVPAARHAGRFATLMVPRPPSFDEVDVSDKPAWIQARPRIGASLRATIDASYRKRQEMLLSVDEMVGSLVDSLRAVGELDRTYLVYTSDNGFHLGEHRLPPRKNTAYEEAMRVPLLVRGPGVPAGSSSDALVLNNDLAPTLATIAGVDVPSFMDGSSLAGLLRSGGTASFPRTGFLIHEGWQNDGSRLGWTALRTARYKYVEWTDGARELYDLQSDPFELQSIHATAPAALLQSLGARLTALKSCQGRACAAAEAN